MKRQEVSRKHRRGALNAKLRHGKRLGSDTSQAVIWEVSLHAPRQAGGGARGREARRDLPGHKAEAVGERTKAVERKHRM